MPTLSERIQRILKFSSRKAKDKNSSERAFFWGASSGSGSSNLFGSNQTLGNFADFVTKGYEANSIIYSAITYKARSISQAFVELDRITDNTDIIEPSHPLTCIKVKPNEYQSWADFNGYLIATLNLSGNAYAYIEREATTLNPIKLYCLRPDKMSIVFGDSGIDGYVYKGDKKENDIILLPEDVVHIKFPNPNDNYNGLGYGLSPMVSLSKNLKVDNMATQFMDTFFSHGAIPPAVLKYKQSISEEDALLVKQRWAEIYGGIKNWSNVGVLGDDASFEKIGFNFQELGLEIIDKRNESRILGPFGVPPMLIGSSIGMENSTFANFEESRTMFWQDTMSYEIGLIQAGLQNKVFVVNKIDDVRLMLSTAKVPALSRDIKPLVETAQILVAMGVPMNIAFETVGLNVKEFDGIEGDVDESEEEQEPSPKEDDTPSNPLKMKKPNYIGGHDKKLKKKPKTFRDK